MRALCHCCAKGRSQGRKAYTQHMRPARWVSAGLSANNREGDVQQCWVQSRDSQNPLILAVLGQLFNFFLVQGSLCQILGDQQHHAKPNVAVWLATSIPISLVSIPPPRSLSCRPGRVQHCLRAQTGHVLRSRSQRGGTQATSWIWSIREQE